MEKGDRQGNGALYFKWICPNLFNNQNLTTIWGKYDTINTDNLLYLSTKFVSRNNEDKHKVVRQVVGRDKFNLVIMWPAQQIQTLWPILTFFMYGNRLFLFFSTYFGFLVNMQKKGLFTALSSLLVHSLLQFSNDSVGNSVIWYCKFAQIFSTGVRMPANMLSNTDKTKQKHMLINLMTWSTTNYWWQKYAG